MADATSWLDEANEVVAREDGTEDRTFFLNMGPSHPSMHGIIRLKLRLEGERVLQCEAEIGYLHRAMEKHSEVSTWSQVFPYTDRLNYVSPLINNVGYAGAVEKLLGIEVTERCKWIRTLMSEVSRVADHETCIGATAMELGAMTAFLYLMKAREWLYELVEWVVGARVTVSYCRIGGLHADLPPGFEKRMRRAIRKTRKVLREVDALLTKNRIFSDRMVGTGKISVEEAHSYGFTGPFLRGCGVPYDVRRAQPYLAYDKVKFEIPTRDSCDNYARYLVRMAEMEQSLRIIEQCLDAMPEGQVNVDPEGKVYAMRPDEYVDWNKVGRAEGIGPTAGGAVRHAGVKLQLSPNMEGNEEPRYHAIQTERKDVALPSKEDTYGNIEGLMRHFKLVMLDHGIRPPKGEAYFPVEGANGELGFYAVSDGTDRACRLRVRPPCFTLLSGLHRMVVGGMVADIVPTFGSINMIGGELDR